MLWQHYFYFNLLDCWILFVVVVIIVIVIFIVASCHRRRYRIAVVIVLPSSSCRSRCWCCRLSPPPSSLTLAIFVDCCIADFWFCIFSSWPSPSRASPSCCRHCHCHRIAVVLSPPSSWLSSSSSFDYLIVVCVLCVFSAWFPKIILFRSNDTPDAFASFSSCRLYFIKPACTSSERELTEATVIFLEWSGLLSRRNLYFS